MITYLVFALILLVVVGVLAAAIVKLRGMAASDNTQRLAQATQRLRYARASAPAPVDDAALSTPIKRAQPGFGRR